MLAVAPLLAAPRASAWSPSSSQQGEPQSTAMGGGEPAHTAGNAAAGVQEPAGQAPLAKASQGAPTEDDPSPPGKAEQGDGSGWDFGPTGLVWRAPDQDLELRFGARLQIDAADFDGTGVSIDDKVDIRRGRLSVSGRYQDRWRFSVERDFLGTVEGWTGVWARYQEKDWRVTVGNQVQPMGLEALQSSAMITFVERAASNALTPGFGMGVSGLYSKEGVGFEAGVFGDPLDRSPSRRAEGTGLVARTFTRLKPEDSKFRLHFGASTELRPLDDGSRLRFRSRPEAGLTDTRLVDTGNIQGADFLGTLGLESAVDYGPLSLQGEWFQTRVDRTGNDLDFGGGYVQVSGFLTGESRRYLLSRGVYRGPTPKREWGALELAARLSLLDLNSADITGGEQTGRTLALNWYKNQNLRVTLEWTRAEADPSSTGGTAEVDIFQVRLGLDF
jgi:phosphate-selective porin OprO and OprP